MARKKKSSQPIDDADNPGIDPDIVRRLLEGGLYVPPSADLEPDCTLEDWNVMEVEIKGEHSRHFVGTSHGEGRVSSAIREYNRETRIGITVSGRTYHLQGEPAHLSRDARYVQDAWLTRNGLKSFFNVTGEYQ